MTRAYPEPGELRIASLGPRTIPSPLGLGVPGRIPSGHYTPDDSRVLADVEARPGRVLEGAASFEKAGPRAELYFDPKSTRAAIVTCGGLCPGVNNVIRSSVLELLHRYRVREVLGFRYGYAGLNPALGYTPMKLGLDEVRHIHNHGGTLLGTSRGAQDVGVMADTLQKADVQILLCVGGDGTLRGAHALHEELARRGAKIAVVGVPKTIDNDVNWIDRTFGFETAVEMAKAAVDSVHTEALAADRGVGLVKLMGRDSGFIAAAATLASLEVNFCLIPEVPALIDGPTGLLAVLDQRLNERRHAVIVVAEGSTYLLDKAEGERDASGNLRFASDGLDVGVRLRDKLNAHFKAAGRPITLKYVDPSYGIRSVPANANDALFCDGLARAAVHAAMAGKTDMVIGHWHGVSTHLPIPVATRGKKRLDPGGAMWLAVTETTGQPPMDGSS